MEDPATSSPGLAFLAGTVAELGDHGWEDYWTDLRANGVAGGRRLDRRLLRRSSPAERPAKATARSSCRTRRARRPRSCSPTRPSTNRRPGVIDSTCVRQVEYAGVLAGTDDAEGARALIDFLLSPEVQADVPLNMFVFPAVDGTPLPDVFEQFAARPADPIIVDPFELRRGARRRHRALERARARLMR